MDAGKKKRAVTWILFLHALVVTYFLAIGIAPKAGVDEIALCTNSSDACVDYSGQTQSATRRKATLPCFHMLLIVIFNKPGFYQNVPFLRDTYESVFTKVVFYGPGMLQNSSGVQPAAEGHNLGLHQQLTVLKALRENPDYDGYLWSGDDVWLNYPMVLSAMNFSRIWLYFGQPPRINYLSEEKFLHNTPWLNWAGKHGIPALREQMKAIPQKYLRRWEHALGGPDRVISTTADVNYLPWKYVEDFIAVCRHLTVLHCEIAIPVTLRLIANNKEDLQYFMNPVYLWEDKRKTPNVFWKNTTSFLHPLKLSDVHMRQLQAKWLEQSKKQFAGTPLSYNLKCSK